MKKRPFFAIPRFSVSFSGEIRRGSQSQACTNGVGKKEEEGKKCEDLIGVPSSLSLSLDDGGDERNVEKLSPQKTALSIQWQNIQAFFLITYLLPLASLRKQGSRSRII